MKKFLCSLLAVFASFLLVTNNQNQKASALTSEEVVLVYLEAPEDWQLPHVWAWNEAGDSAFSVLGWPGKAMIADSANDGWFYLYVPKTMETAILNNGLSGDDAAQSEAFTLLASDMWVTIAADAEEKLIATPSAVKATIGDAPEFIDTIYVFALVPIDWDAAGIWAWTHPAGTNAIAGSSWPGTAMDLQSDGWFMLEIPAVANRVIITDLGTPTAEQSVDIDLLEGNNYIVLGEKDGDKYSAEAYAEKPIIIEDGFTIYVTVPEDWLSPHAWAWSHPDGTNLYPNWPGEPLTFDEENAVWVLIVPDWVNRIIINNDLDGTVVQTGDIDLPAEGEEFELIIGEAGSDGKYEFTITVKGAIVEEPTDPPVDDTEDEDDKKASPWLYVGIGGGALVVIGLAVGLFFFMKKRK